MDNINNTIRERDKEQQVLSEIIDSLNQTDTEIWLENNEKTLGRILYISIFCMLFAWLASSETSLFECTIFQLTDEELLVAICGSLLGCLQGKDYLFFTIFTILLSVYLYKLSLPFERKGLWNYIHKLNWITLRIGGNEGTIPYKKNYNEYCNDKTIKTPNKINALKTSFTYILIFYRLKYLIPFFICYLTCGEPTIYKGTIIEKYDAGSKRNTIEFTVKGIKLERSISKNTYKACAIGDTIEIEVRKGVFDYLHFGDFTIYCSN